MDESKFSSVDPLLIAFVLFLFMLFALWLGHRMRRKFWSAEEGETKGGINSLLGALFGLWGFMLAFTFNQSGNRFENVRGMIVDESNILRNTILKADFFPDSIRNAYRTELRKYLEERIAYYDDVDDEEKFNKNRKELSMTSRTLWAMTVEQSKNPELRGVAGGMSASLASLFDIGIKREALLSFGIPTPISAMLITLALAICLVGGFTTPAIQRKEWMVIAMFALLATTILYITMDLSQPMSGMIKPNTGQATIVKLRQLF
jgi:uncharacterized membrane protein YphA (DoxX/SURF4 family)